MYIVWLVKPLAAPKIPQPPTDALSFGPGTLIQTLSPENARKGREARSNLVGAWALAPIAARRQLIHFCMLSISAKRWKPQRDDARDAKG